MKGLSYQERIIGGDEGNWTKEALYRVVPDARSVPQVFIKGNYIGGYKEVREYLNDNVKNT
jgi:glutaredoxin